jgi:hypothetical protein
MTVLETARFLLKKYTSGGDPHPTRDEHNLMIDAIENNAVMGAQGITSARPAAGKGRRLFWDETAQRAWYDDGANWKDLNPNGGGGGGAKVTPGVDGVEGASNRSARADHTHRLDLATGAAAGAMSAADKALLDTATAAATANAVAKRDANGRLSVNTPVDAGQAATKGYVDGILTQAADYADAKTLAGAAPQALAPLAVTGYSLAGKVYVKHEGALNRITVVVKVTRTGGNGVIPTGPSFAGFGAILPAGARDAGTDAPDLYLPVAISGGSTNAHATLFLDPQTGVMSIKATGADFTMTTGATFTVNADYLVTAP